MYLCMCVFGCVCVWVCMYMRMYVCSCVCAYATRVGRSRLAEPHACGVLCVCASDFTSSSEINVSFCAIVVSLSAGRAGRDVQQGRHEQKWHHGRLASTFVGRLVRRQL
jgi:hypothetical protein